jgi:hypothetical protein
MKAKDNPPDAGGVSRIQQETQETQVDFTLGRKAKCTRALRCARVAIRRASEPNSGHYPRESAQSAATKARGPEARKSSKFGISKSKFGIAGAVMPNFKLPG